MNHFTLPHQHGQSMEQLLEHIPDSEHFEILASIFKLLGDPTRIRLFWILCHCEECVINLSAMINEQSCHCPPSAPSAFQRPGGSQTGGQRNLLPDQSV